LKESDSELRRLLRLEAWRHGVINFQLYDVHEQIDEDLSIVVCKHKVARARVRHKETSLQEIPKKEISKKKLTA